MVLRVCVCACARVRVWTAATDKPRGSITSVGTASSGELTEKMLNDDHELLTKTVYLVRKNVEDIKRNTDDIKELKANASAKAMLGLGSAAASVVGAGDG